MIYAIRGDITQIQGVDFICNAANGMGPMRRGVAGAIHRAGGPDIEKEAYVVCSKVDYQPGDLYVTNAGKLPYKKVLHLVTMKKPGGPTSYEIVEKCLKSLLFYCRTRNIKKVALPALATGVGNLDRVRVASIFKEFFNEANDIDFYVVDMDPVFIYEFQKGD